jgi:hypothetical protein
MTVADYVLGDSLLADNLSQLLSLGECLRGESLPEEIVC